MMRKSYIPLLLTALLALGACSILPSWLGGEKKAEPKLEGKRIDVFHGEPKLKPDSSLAETPVDVPTAEPNPSWPQHAGGADGRPAEVNPMLPISLDKRTSAQVGNGAAFDYHLVSPPVVGGGAVFAMDANGAVSAHDAKNVGEVRWISPGAAGENTDEPALGGGLAYDSGKVFAASGKGLVVALDAKTGSELWRQNLGIPIRSAPHVADSRVYVVTVDCQIYALDATSGAILWNQRGVDEGRGFITEASPVAAGDIVVAPYVSGEIHALRPDTGDEIWSDGVVGSQRQSAASVFTGIAGDPVLTPDGMLYVAGSAGQFAVFQAETGRRLWEQPISSVNTPYVAGNYVYILTNDSMVLCLQRMDGKVKWARQLPEFADAKEKQNRYTWSGPVLAGGRLLVVGAHGKMLELSPQDGSTLAATDIPEGAYAPPVVAGGALYLLTEDATLHALY